MSEFKKSDEHLIEVHNKQEYEKSDRFKKEFDDLCEKYDYSCVVVGIGKDISVGENIKTTHFHFSNIKSITKFQAKFLSLQAELANKDIFAPIKNFLNK